MMAEIDMDVVDENELEDVSMVLTPKPNDLDVFSKELCNDRCGLIMDTRERAVIPFIEAQIKDYPMIIAQVTAGDYSIVYRGRFVAIIERKTLDDYAASIKDSRHENKEKMKAVRKEHNCQVYYIVEGPLKPPPSAKYGGRGSHGIPYWPNIDNSIFHLRTHHDIFVIRSENMSDTAVQLERLLIALTDRMRNNRIPANLVIDLTDTTGGSIAETLSSQTRRTDDRIVIEIWKGIGGVSETIANSLLNLVSIADLLTGSCVAADPSCKNVRDYLKKHLRTGNGRVVADKTLSNIANLANRETNYDMAALAKYTTLNKMLANIPGLTRSSAGNITGAIKSWELPNATATEIGAIQQTAKKRIGVAMGEKILKYLKHRPEKVV